MAKYVDLGLLVREPLIFAVPIGEEDGEILLEEFKIPGELSTGFVYKMTKYYNDIQSSEDEEVVLEKMRQIVVDILNLDKSKSIDIDYVEEYLDGFRMLNAIFQNMMAHIKEISEDPNLKRPKSTSRKKTVKK